MNTGYRTPDAGYRRPDHGRGTPSCRFSLRSPVFGSRLPPEANIPENAKVYVVFPGLASQRAVRIFSPRLLHPEEAADFVKEVIPENTDAGL